MTFAVATPYLDRATTIARMARAIKDAPDIVMNSRGARMLAYENFGVEPRHAQRDENDRAAVASELARRRAFAS